MLEKTYQPAEIEPRIDAEWEKAEAFKGGRADRAERRALLDRHSAAERDGLAAHGACAQQHAAGRALPLRAHARHATCCGSRAPTTPASPRRWSSSASSWSARSPTGASSAARNSSSRVWAWKAESGGTIVNQLKRLGASCDWSRERFTMDEGLSQAPSLKVFVELYTPRADLQGQAPRQLGPGVPDRDLGPRGRAGREGGTFTWTVRRSREAVRRQGAGEDPRPRSQRAPLSLPLPAEGRSVEVTSSSRPRVPRPCWATPALPCIPRTSAIRRSSARRCVLPLVGREIPIVADEYSDPEKGTGAVKITPAHDFNDFEVGTPPRARADQHLRRLRRKLNDEVPEAYRGLDRFEARKRVVADLEALGLLEKIEPTTHAVPHGDAVERRHRAVADRPVVRQRRRAGEARASRPSRAARRKLRPGALRQDYFGGCDNIQPWCISRQLWWGHQIPAWYGPDGQSVRCLRRGRVAARLTPAETQHWTSSRRSSSTPRRGRPRHVVLLRPVAVLDARLAGQTREVERFYPTSALVTGFDIIFFWVARMMMMGHALHEGGAVPRRLHPRAWCATRRAEDVQDARATSSIPWTSSTASISDALIAKRTAGLIQGAGQPRREGNAQGIPGRHQALRRRRAALHAGRHGRAGPRHQALARSASRAIATSRPSSGTRRASPR